MGEVLVDPRAGSGDLVAPLIQLGVPAKLEQLEYGDVQIIGRGPEERPVLIGVEVKTLSDLLQCIKDHRFVGHQLPGLLASYERSYLLLEGCITAAPTRELMYLSGGRWRHVSYVSPDFSKERAWSYESLMSWTFSIERTGLRMGHTCDRRGSVAWIAALWSNWSKAPSEHKSLRVVRGKPLSADGLEENPFDVKQASRKMKAFAEFAHGLGYTRVQAAAKHFRSIRAGVNATEADWCSVDGIGKRLASTIVANLIEETDE